MSCQIPVINVYLSSIYCLYLNTSSERQNLRVKEKHWSLIAQHKGERLEKGNSQSSKLNQNNLQCCRDEDRVQKMNVFAHSS